MVTTLLYLSIEMFYRAIHVQYNDKLWSYFTLYVPHLKIVLYTMPNIKSARIWSVFY